MLAATGPPDVCAQIVRLWGGCGRDFLRPAGEGSAGS
jgi:hypothetical protein